MATGRWYKCPVCGHQESKWPPMFCALQGLSEQRVASCPDCHTNMQLHLAYAFALGVGKTDAVALASFLPKSPPKWDNNGREVTFYPFLVIVKVSSGEELAWLPYFHIVKDPKKQTEVCRYGQWAPFMGLTLFEDVLGQARSAGYLDIGG